PRERGPAVGWRAPGGVPPTALAETPPPSPSPGPPRRTRPRELQLRSRGRRTQLEPHLVELHLPAERPPERDRLGVPHQHLEVDGADPALPQPVEGGRDQTAPHADPPRLGGDEEVGDAGGASAAEILGDRVQARVQEPDHGPALAGDEKDAETPEGRPDAPEPPLRAVGGERDEQAHALLEVVHRPEEPPHVVETGIVGPKGLEFDLGC